MKKGKNMKYYMRARKECVKLGCKCVDCLKNHDNEKYCCWNCGTCSSENCGGTTKYDHFLRQCRSYIQRGKNKKNKKKDNQKKR